MQEVVTSLRVDATTIKEAQSEKNILEKIF